MRGILARTLGVFVAALGLALIWNGATGFRFTDAMLGFVVLGLDILAGVVLLAAGHWFWRRQKRALRVTSLGLALAVAAGTLAAWHYTTGTDRTPATIGAAAGGLVFAVVIELLARLALNPPVQDQLSLFPEQD